MPSRRTVTVAVAGLLTVSLATASYAAKPTPGTTGSVASYGGDYKFIDCRKPAPNACAASGRHDVGTGALQASASLRRTVKATGEDSAGFIPLVGRSFYLKQPANQITGTVTFTKVRGTASALSNNGTATGVAYLTARILDNGCADHDCGAEGALATSYVAWQRTFSRADVSAAGPSVAGGATRTLTVTIAMPNGGKLPAGRISVEGWVGALAVLGEDLCRNSGFQACPREIAHTGSASASISATVSSITWSIT